MYREQKIKLRKETVPIVGKKLPESDGRNVEYDSSNWRAARSIVITNEGD